MLRTRFGSNSVGLTAANDKATSTGIMVGYRSGAGSNAAGILKREREGLP